MSEAFREQKPQNNIENNGQARHSSIESETLADIKNHIGESFESEEIIMSSEKLKYFLEATGDINRIHFDPEGAKSSVFSEDTSGKIVVPGFLTLSLCANKKVLYEALKIKEPNEIISLELTSVKFLAPVAINTKVVYEYRLKSAKERTIKSRPSIITEWGIAVFASSDDNNHKRNLCMKASWMVAYVAQQEPK